MRNKINVRELFNNNVKVIKLFLDWCKTSEELCEYDYENLCMALELGSTNQVTELYHFHKGNILDWLEEQGYYISVPVYYLKENFFYGTEVKRKDEFYWKPIQGYENLYKISNYGDILSFHKNKEGFLLSPSLGSNGYFSVSLYKNGKLKRCSIHRLIAKTFIPNPENKPMINHIDGDKLNNSLGNLEWVTDRENKNHAIENNLYALGERNGNTELTDEDAINIHFYASKGVGLRDINKVYNISMDVFMSIKKVSCWKHLNLPVIKGRSSSITYDDIIKIEELLEYKSINSIARETKFCKKTISNVKKGVYNHIKEYVNSMIKSHNGSSAHQRPLFSNSGVKDRNRAIEKGIQKAIEDLEKKL